MKVVYFVMISKPSHHTFEVRVTLHSRMTSVVVLEIDLGLENGLKTVF